MDTTQQLFVLLPNDPRCKLQHTTFLEQQFHEIVLRFMMVDGLWKTPTDCVYGYTVQHWRRSVNTMRFLTIKSHFYRMKSHCVDTLIPVCCWDIMLEHWDGKVFYQFVHKFRDLSRWTFFEARRNRWKRMNKLVDMELKCIRSFWWNVVWNKLEFICWHFTFPM